MNTIAFDTATDIFSVGLLINSRPEKRYYLTVDGGQRHSEVIMDAADSLFRIAGFERENLEAVACMEGPGSFTGLRIGFAAAKGLAFALGIPFIPVPTLDCMACRVAFWPGMVLPVIDAKKNSFFAALYNQGKRLTPYLDIDSETLIKTIKGAGIQQGQTSNLLLVTGPAVHLVKSGIKEAFTDAVFDSTAGQGYAAELLNLVTEKGIFNTRPADHAAGPMYIRKSDAELNVNMDYKNG